MSNITDTQSGSIWRRWDLHIHAPGTKLSNGYGDPQDDAVWNRYIDLLESSPVQVFGITDYFCCDTYFSLIDRYSARHPNSTKVFFPNVELRLSQSISADGGLPHIHLLFDNDPAVANQDKVQRFFTNLSTQSVNDDNARTRCTDLKSRSDFEAATVSLDDLLKALGETFGDSKPYLIAFPANNDGLRSTDSKSPKKVKLADRIDQTSHLFFGNQGNRDFLLRTDRYASGPSEPKPVVSASDAHSFEDLDRLTGDVADYPATWIKADTTFTGLRQLQYEPESRVWIGEEPDVVKRQREDGTKFLTELRIDQIEVYKENNGRWFKNVLIPLNPELIAIIGNKGSGKSALVDIVGLLGNSRQENYFSFLTDDSKSKKFRQRGFAENFSGTIMWSTAKCDTKHLNEHCDNDAPETVRYLPQNYFETLTNEIEIEHFRHEIEDVVFSHVDDTDKLGKTSFAALEEAKTLQGKEEVSALKKRLRELNVHIVRLEEQSSARYRKQLSAQIAAKEEELSANDAAKPKEVPPPDTETQEQKDLAGQVAKLTALATKLSSKRDSSLASLTSQKAMLHNAVSLKDRLTAFSTKTLAEIKEYGDAMQGLGLAVADIVEFRTNQKPLNDLISNIESKISALENDSKHAFSNDTDWDGLVTIPDLESAQQFLSGEIEKVKEQLSGPQRRYQSYLERLETWSLKRKEILGSETDPKSGTLQQLRNQRDYLDGPLADELQAKMEARRQTLHDIFESKSKILRFYSDLKKSVEERLESVRTDGFAIQIDASFVVDHDFRRQFLAHIDQRKRGPYRNEQDAQQLIERRLRETNWNDFESVQLFCGDLLDAMKTHNGETLVASEQAHNVKDLYDFVFSLDYLSSKYELRLGDKNLNELSPGEKGLLLLIFYLQLDRQNTPLVIDQPEDNLDNDSIFKVLAKCIREAKKRRQVILVTHNPNLAVGADAEQIVYVRLEKTQNYKFSYESGSIENPQLNRRIVDVLEGSQPAFVKRRLKYGIA